MSAKWFVSRSYGLALMFLGVLVSAVMIIAAAIMYLPVELYYFIHHMVNPKDRAEPTPEFGGVAG